MFDIETSSFYEGDEKRCTMYAWVFGLNGRCIRGRTWQEFLDVIDKLCAIYKLSVKRRLIVYVHNLSYEFQWFRKYFKWNKVFAVDNRKPVYAIAECGIEFRCSYLLSGYSLETLGKNLTKYKVNKLKGDLNYKLIRHSSTPLTDKEWGYILNDGLVVMAHIQEEIERLGDITQLPLTNTGYVRMLCKEKCLKGEERFDYTRLIKHLTLTSTEYKQAKQTYIGGFTHANVNYVGDTIENADSFDFTSSYPAVMVSEKYPMSKPHKYMPKDEKDFLECLESFCCMFVATFYNIRSIASFENYISLSKCTVIEHYVVNNGRIVEADKLQLFLTEQDYFIISELYEWDYIDIADFHYMYKTYLPKPFVMTILELYKKKTELKGVEGAEVEYLVSKGMVNSLYGMCVTDICRGENAYNNGKWEFTEANADEQMEKYNKNRERFLYYLWGIWVTAYARANLFSGIIEFADDYIYSDTDSLKVLNADKHQDYIKEYNIRVTNKINACLDYHNISRDMACPKTIKGVPKPLGVWDYEGRYDLFKTLGAKRYMYTQGNELTITIAGVSKFAGKKYLLDKYGDIPNVFANFDDDIEFPAEYTTKDGEEENGSGKMLHTYIDDEMKGTVIDYLGNENEYFEGSGIHLENTEYTLGLNGEFKNFILGVKGNHII